MVYLRGVDRRTRKHGNVVNVVELAVIFSVESSPDVGDEDLRTLHDAHSAAFKFGAVIEAREVVREEIYEFPGAVISSGYEIYHSAFELL